MKDLAKRIRRRIRRRLIRVLSHMHRETINGVSIVIPHIGGIEPDTTEPWMINVLKRILPEHRGRFVDIGVNLGQTLVKVKALDPIRNYIGFEPNPECVYYTGELIAANSFDKCTIIPVGLAQKTRLGILYSIQDSGTDSAATIVKGFRKDHNVAREAYISLYNPEGDSIGEEIFSDTVGVVKIDVEGAELYVLQSLLFVISRDLPAIIIEILPVYSVDQEPDRYQRQQKLEQLMRSLGYVFYRIAEKSSDNIKLMKIDDIGVHGEIEWSDYVLLHSKYNHLESDK